MGINTQGAASGAASGAALGPWGAAIGGVLGAFNSSSGGGGGLLGGGGGAGGGMPFAIPDKFDIDHSGWNVNFGSGDISSSATKGGPDDSIAGTLGNFTKGTGINLNAIVLIFGALIAIKIVMGGKK